MGNIVKYHNDLNNLVFKTFNVNELDIFYTIIFKMKDKSEATFTINEIKKISIIEKKNRSLKRFFKHLDNVFKTQLQIRNEEGLTDYNLFITKNINVKETEIKIKLHPDCIYILNDLLKNFTKFELTEFLSLKSEYSKVLFRHFKQFENGKERKVYFNFEDFRLLLNIPENYKQCNIDQKILKPVLTELKKEIYPNLDYEKIAFKGRKINQIIFYFDGLQQTIFKEPLVEHIEIEKTYSQEVEDLFSILKADERIDSRKEELEKMLREHSFEIIESNIKYTNKRSKDNYSKYLRDAVTKDWAKEEREKEKAKQSNLFQQPTADAEQPEIEKVAETGKSNIQKIRENIKKKSIQ